MKYVVAIVVALVVFVLVLTFWIVPQQNGNASATSLQADRLAKADYAEQLPIQEVGLGPSGRSIVIAVVMLTHILYANLQLGGAWIAAGTESVYLRNGKERFKRLARSLTLFNVILFSTGATFAAAGFLFFISLYPAFADQVFHIYWWPLLAETILFGIQIAFLYGYWFSWDRISARWHQFLGYAFAVAVFFQTLMINTLASGMLTPGSTAISWGGPGFFTMPLSALAGWWFNATTWILQFHRLAAAVSYFGFLLAMIAMFHFVDRKDDAAKTYWDLVGSYGLSWGLLGLIFQPVLGLLYIHLIRADQMGAFIAIMLGPRAWEMLLMVGLLSFLFITILVYLYARKELILVQEENRRLHQLFKGSIVVAVICTFVLIQPATLSSGPNPLGYMFYKLIALFLLIWIGAALLGIDLILLREPGLVAWGHLSVRSRAAVILAGILGMWIVVVMGFVRESARSPWLVNGIIPVPGGASYPTPIPVFQIFAVWIIITASTLLIFWLVSRVTAEHPEKAEEV